MIVRRLRRDHRGDGGRLRVEAVEERASLGRIGPQLGGEEHRVGAADRNRDGRVGRLAGAAGRRARDGEPPADGLRAQLGALHRRQFKGRRNAGAGASGCSSARRKKRGAPVGHPPWQRAKPQRIDQVVDVVVHVEPPEEAVPEER